MKVLFRQTAVCFSIATATAVNAQTEEQAHAEEEIDVIIVTAPFEATEAETALPIGVISAEALREKVGNSIGDTLKNEIGVNSASFGNGVGQPIIRGQSGNRVSILQNGISLTDASNVSPDHASGVEPLLAERIEVLRGPSALLYGSGAIGGVVNVIDSRVPATLVDGPTMLLEQSYNSVSDEDKTLVRFDTANGDYGFHFNAFRRENQDMDIPGFAIDEAGVEQLEELTASFLGQEHGEEEHEEHEEELVNSNGYVANSSGEAEGGTLGFSRVSDQGYFGFAISKLDNNYGLPPGTHGHHDEEEEEEHGEDHEESQDLVRLNLEQTRYDFKSQYNFSGGWFENLEATMGYTDYEHQEIEFGTDGASGLGTRYSNEGLEGRIALNHRHEGAWAGVWGMQFTATEFSALGAEAFIPESQLDTVGLFGMHRYNTENFTAEFGLRVEQNAVDPVGQCEYDTTSTSLSASLLRDVSADSNVLLGLTRSQRGPSVEELYSNVSSSTCAAYEQEENYVLHAATALMEIGNAQLDKETSNNIEFGFRKHAGRVTGEFSAYYNEIDDFIYLDITGEQIAEQTVARYLARDAVFKGLEAQVEIELLDGVNHSVALSFFGDVVKAEFDQGGYVPRIPPSKLGMELRWFGPNWSVHFHGTRMQAQNNTATLELPTDAYTNLSLYADYHWSLTPRTELQVFVKGDNLLDEEIRNHASFLKHYSPEAGRGFRVGLRLFY